jgi:hypothetical protein
VQCGVAYSELYRTGADAKLLLSTKVNINAFYSKEVAALLSSEEVMLEDILLEIESADSSMETMIYDEEDENISQEETVDDGDDEDGEVF